MSFVSERRRSALDEDVERLVRGPYGSLAARIVAAVIDFGLLYAAQIGLYWALARAETGGAPGAEAGSGVRLLAGAIGLLLIVGYFAGFEASRWAATPGKLVAGLRVTDLSGERIAFARALGRFGAKLLSIAPVGVGLLIAPFQERRQAFHDLLAGTVVLPRSRKSGGP